MIKFDHVDCRFTNTNCTRFITGTLSKLSAVILHVRPLLKSADLNYDFTSVTNISGNVKTSHDQRIKKVGAVF